VIRLEALRGRARGIVLITETGNLPRNLILPDVVWIRLRSESNHEKRAALICLLTAALAANGTATTTPYVNRLLLKNGKYIDAPSIAPGKGKKSSSGTTVVDNEADADAALIYFGPDGDTDPTTNPKAFDQGWRDGWKWASKQSAFSSDEPAEKMEAKLLMPWSADLPDDLKASVRRNALQVTDTGFDDDCAVSRSRSSKL
jgi:hypothetical protein